MSSTPGTRRLVVKAGSAILLDPDGGLDRGFLARLAASVAERRRAGWDVVLVSSGAVALGRRRLQLPKGSVTLEEKQAAAAAGQSRLMAAWEAEFEPHGLPAAQVLLTRDDTETRRRWLNARATLETLLRLGAVPVVNENDTVATEEIRYGDNDRLAARVAQLVGAEVLLLLSDVDGLYEADPRLDPAARRLDEVPEVTAEVLALASGPNRAAGVGSGGMRTKLEAARIAQAAGCATLIAAGRRAGTDPLAALSGAAPATRIPPRTTPLAAKKSWIAGTLAPQGRLTVDPGAARALRSGKSLLPAGVRRVEGAFGKGDPVLVLGPDGEILATGLAAYDSEAARRIAGLRSEAVEPVLGRRASAMIHRNDLALAGPAGADLAPAAAAPTSEA